MIARGLADLHAGKTTPEGLLLIPAARRLCELGVDIPNSALDIAEPEIALYRALGERLDGTADDPYYRYNSWRDELASFVSALEHRRNRSA